MPGARKNKAKKPDSTQSTTSGFNGKSKANTAQANGEADTDADAVFKNCSSCTRTTDETLPCSCTIAGKTCPSPGVAQ